jgi:dihydrodipicolinate synthase/N-acetylneuraminate lyase
MAISRRQFVTSVGAAAVTAGVGAVGQAAEKSSQPGGASAVCTIREAKGKATMNDYRAIVERIKGPLVPISPAFTKNDDLDLDSTQRWLQWIVDSGIPLVWLTYGASRYASLTDQEIFDLTSAVGQVTRGRCILIAATNMHWPVHQCRRYLKHAADCGADVVTIQCNWFCNPSEEAVFQYYRTLSDGSPLPLFAYTLKLPGVAAGMSDALLRRILELPQVVGMKNDSGDFYEHRAYLATIREHGSRFVPITGGSMMSFLWGYDFGAQAFASGYGMIDPATPLAFYRHLSAGQRDEAVAIVRNREEPMLAALSGIGGWDALRVGLVCKGLFASWRERFPKSTLTAEQAEQVKGYFVKNGLI